MVGRIRQGKGYWKYWGWRDGEQVLLMVEHIQKMLTEMKAWEDKQSDGQLGKSLGESLS